MEAVKIIVPAPSPIKLHISSNFPSSSSGGTTYQKSTALQWVIVHNRGYRPSVTCTDTTGEVIIPEIIHVSLNEVHINHTFNQAGTVYIN
ncbi:hypothetical protein AHMF7605_11660 [Adhaeribacter arboris]|uniref:Uncharacterized protein n=1 Tax=Adhaeribacter arboris TaxID=2072846 RepID=A0A2T2YF88_9BACT|nr:hypothetical protein [Adhaeribacter arboris]PSR54128.1 hypothetical protein AHMF7605_11660 [Adhaeribacter arboris]